jgi:DNA-directed RNA polymerase specialized sigma24 family protein
MTGVALAGTFEEPSDKKGVVEAPADAAAIRASLIDGEAFLEVVERHFDKISRFLRRRVAREIADELTAEVFTVAFARRESYDLSRASALPWLYGIASNLLRNRLRSELRELELLARAAVDPLAASGDPLDRVLKRSVEPGVISPTTRSPRRLTCRLEPSSRDLAVRARTSVQRSHHV